MADPLWKRAEYDLCLQVAGSPPDPLVWEHSARVARLVEIIRDLPEVNANGLDAAALTAAALYHDAAWVLQARSGEIHPREMLLRPCSDLQREVAAGWMGERLAGVLGPGIVTQAVRIVRDLSNRRSPSAEAQILAEADNLDQVGPQAMCLMLRKQLAEGKTIGDLVAVWDRQEEYNYWPARIKDSFRIPVVRQLAERRLDVLRRFMADLKRAVRLEDLEGLTGNV